MQRNFSRSFVKFRVAFIVTFFTYLTNSACTPDLIEVEYVNIDSLLYDKSDNQLFIVVAHWNIGHFSKGKAPYTKIESQKKDSLRVLYQDFINQAEADIFGLCEYNPTFSVEGEDTSELLFSDFPYSYIGRQYLYNCNSIFSNRPLFNCQQIHFSNCVQHRYFSVSDIVVHGTLVKFVETHLDFNQGSYGNSYRLSQMQELVEYFSNSPHVIVCADYNSSLREEYEVFRIAGYSFATDSLPNAGSTSSDSLRIMIDNILVKGFEIKETKVFPHMSLSDHNMICSKLRLKEL